MSSRSTNFDPDENSLGTRATMYGTYIGLVIIVSLLATIYVAWDVSSFESSVSEAIYIRADSVSTVITPNLVKKTPLAILVLDLSGSMTGNDDGFAQFSALEIFLRIYRHIATGAIGEGEKPNLGLVLYSGVARTVWYEDQPWIPLDDDSRVDEVLSYMAGIIGSPELTKQNDPRIGWRTDHVAAADAVRDIIEKYRKEVDGTQKDESACVLFMTDGGYDPSPLVDASLNKIQLAQNRRAFWDSVKSPKRGLSSSQIKGAVGLEAKFEDWLEKSRQPLYFNQIPRTEDLFPLISLRRAGRGIVGNSWGWFDEPLKMLRGEDQEFVTTRELQKICGLGPKAPYFPILLADPNVDVAGWGDSVAANDLSFSFAAALAEWLELKPLPVSNDNQFNVQPDSRALAVLVAGKEGPASGLLKHGNEQEELNQGLALIETPSPGPWRIDCNEGGLRSIKVFSDTRYQWALRDWPKVFSILTKEAHVRLALHDTEQGGIPIHPHKLYSKFPSSAKCEFFFGDGQSSEQLLIWRESLQMYEAKLPPEAAAFPGNLIIRVHVEGLLYSNGMVSSEVEAETVVTVGDVVDIGLFTWTKDGEETRISSIQNVKIQQGGYLGKGEGE